MKKIRIFIAKLIMAPFVASIILVLIFGLLSFLVASLFIPSEGFETISKKFEKLNDIVDNEIKSSTTGSTSTTKE